MLKFYKTTQQGLIELDEPTNGGWIDVINPDPEEIGKLGSWGINADLINYSLDLDEMAHSERDEDYMFILMRIPVNEGPQADIPYRTAPLGIVLTERHVVTICRWKNDITKPLCNGKYSGMRTAKRYRFALYVILEIALRYLSHLREINRTTETLEDQLIKSTRNHEVMELLKFQKSLVYFTTALRSNQVVMQRLQRMQVFNQFDEDKELLEDVITENEQAIEMTNIANDILSSMMDAFASIISNNLNTVMKALTAITIVVSLPTLVSSFYGMNVNLPFMDQPWAFWFTLVLAAVMVVTAIFIFMRRDWF